MRKYLHICVCVSVASFVWSGISAADDLGKKSADRKLFKSPESAMALLIEAHRRDSNSFVLQAELDSLIDEGGGGACVSAVGIDLLQVLRVMAGFDRLPNPHRVVLESFRKQPELLKGRVTNARFTELMKHYQKHLEGVPLDVEVVSAPNSPNRTDEKTWILDQGPGFDVGPGKIRVLSYKVTERNGNVLGRHFVLIKTHEKGQIQVLDPTNPQGDRRYILEMRRGKSGECEQVFLLNPAGIPRGDNVIYEVDTVFTFAMRNSADPTRSGPIDPISVTNINRRIDETAAKFRGTEKFLDPRAWRKQTAGFGLPGLDLPQEVGGSDWPAIKMVEVFRHAGAHNLNFRDVVGGAHVRPLLASKNLEVREIVRQVAKGDGYIAIAITEPTAGSDFTAMKSTSRKVDGGYVISGEKRFNARLDQATHVIIFTQGTSGEEGKLSAFVVPLNTAGLTVKRFPAHGLTGNSYGGIVFKDLFVPEKYLIGEDGKGGGVFFHHFMYWRLMQAAAAIGTGENALDQMAERIKVRHAFGGPIGRFTHLQQQIGQHTTELKMAFALSREAAELLDRGEYSAAQPLISGLKAEGVEIALRASDAAMRAFGGEGYSTMVDLGDRVRDLMGLRIADGTTDVMRMDVVRRTFGDEFWEMSVQKKKER